MKSESDLERLIADELSETEPPGWTVHIDMFIEKRLAIYQMVNVLNKLGFKISRQGLSDWLNRHRPQDIQYTKRKFKKRNLDRADAEVVPVIDQNVVGDKLLSGGEVKKGENSTWITPLTLKNSGSGEEKKEETIGGVTREQQIASVMAKIDQMVGR